MISLSNIVKAKSFRIYTGQESGAAAVQGNAVPSENSGKTAERVLEHAIKRARLIHDEAVKRAEDLIKKAEKESESIRLEALREGYEEGYTNGFSEGAEKAKKAAEDGLRDIENLIEGIRKERMEAIERQEKDLIAIAFEIAKKIMRQQILIDENAIPKMLEQVIMENESGLRIYLPEYSKTLDLAIDKSIAQRIRNLSENVKVVVTENDDFLMAETENGMVDMSIPVQISQLQEAVEEAFLETKLND